MDLDAAASMNRFFSGPEVCLPQKPPTAQKRKPLNERESENEEEGHEPPGGGGSWSGADDSGTAAAAGGSQGGRPLPCV